MKISVKFSIVKFHSYRMMSILINGPHEACEIETFITLTAEVLGTGKYLHKYFRFPLHGVLPG